VSDQPAAEDLNFKDPETFDQWLEFFKLAFAAICGVAGTPAGEEAEAADMSAQAAVKLVRQRAKERVSDEP